MTTISSRYLPIWHRGIRNRVSVCFSIPGGLHVEPGSTIELSPVAIPQIASYQFSPVENSATMTRPRRGACQPGATLRGCVRVHVPPCKGGGFLHPCRAHRSIQKTQGVALGWIAAALSAPESKLYKSEFTSFDSSPFVRWLLLIAE